jgi:hypothetical protein
MDGADIPSHSAADGDRPPENADDGGVEDERAAAPPPERCGALASAIAGVLAGALREHEERAAATARSQDEVAAAIDRLNGGRCLSPPQPWAFSAGGVMRCARCGLDFSSFGCVPFCVDTRVCVLYCGVHLTQD